jgi:ABC-2 type transport system ATP-binding protein
MPQPPKIMPNPKGISCHNLSKSYGEFVALENLNLTVTSGKILGFVGVNGAGKTTALRCLAGIIPPSKGQIKIDNVEMTVDAVAAKKVSCFVPDTPHLFDYLSVEDHLRFAGRIYGLGDIDERITTLLTQFDLLDKANALPETLSRGMKQKVAICLGFLHQPKAVFLDEPLTGLDPIGIRHMKEAIALRAREQQAAVIVSSHQLELIEEICDEILILHKGRCISYGTIAQLQAQIGDIASELSLEALFFELIDQHQENN